MNTAPRALAAALTLAACSQAPPPSPSTPFPIATTLDALVADSVASLVIQRLLASDALLEEPDSLFAAGAAVIADGERRVSVPRLAGVGLGGRVQLVTSQVSTRGAFVWGVMEYRWVPVFDSDAVRAGVATIVIAALPDEGWRIVHLHSSAPVADRPEMTRPASPDTLEDAGRWGSR